MNRLPEPQGGLTLRDIHLPPPPSWWPLAPGWWVVIALVLVSVVVLFWLLRRRRQLEQARARVLARLDEIDLRHRDDDARYAAALHEFLRRIARSYDLAAGNSHGQAWRKVLASVAVDEPTLDLLMTLDTRMYQPNALFERKLVADAAQRWLSVALKSRAREVARA